MLELSNISIDLGQFSLHDVSFTVEEGEYVCLAGPTGAGKTVLLECAAGLHRPDRGRVLLNGRDITDLPPERRGIGYVPQDYALFPHMNVLENITYGLVERETPSKAARDKAESAAGLLQISHLLHRDVTTLSGGERQRVALARTLVLDCKLLLLDEPLSALDSATTKELSLYLAEIHRRLNLTVLHVTHDFTEAFSLASHIAICHAGRLLQTGTLREVFTKPICRTVASFLGISNIYPRRDQEAASCPLASRLEGTDQRPLDGYCICIRPDQISIGRSEPSSDGLAFEAVVRDVRWMGPTHEVTLDAGVPLVATLSRQEHEALGLQVGDPIQVSIDTSAIHMLEDR